MKKNRYWGLVAAVLMLTACQEGKKTGTTTSEQKTGTIVVKAQTATLTLNILPHCAVNKTSRFIRR